MNAGNRPRRDERRRAREQKRGRVFFLATVDTFASRDGNMNDFKTLCE